MPEPVSLDTPATSDSKAPPRRSRQRTTASEPRIERIVVGGEAGETATDGEVATEDPTAPARKGWWQRRLGGE
jgi:ribonuclease E